MPKYPVQFVFHVTPSEGTVEFMSSYEYHEELAHELGKGFDDVCDTTALVYIPEDY